jgi:hypothetical protein
MMIKTRYSINKNRETGSIDITLSDIRYVELLISDIRTFISRKEYDSIYLKHIGEKDEVENDVR